tara:strand:+ start:315 stop:512 length:198 start_codon:yes stop_codon:yes gene_type:complete
MIFPTRRIKTNDGFVEAWTPLPEAGAWPGFRRMMMAGTLVDVPDHLLAKDVKPKRKRGRPRKEVE